LADFLTHSNIKFHKYTTRGSSVVPCGQTDRHSDTWQT